MRLASTDPPDLPGIPGQIAKAAHAFRKATQIFPPPGMGLGVGLGLGCGVGWPLRAAYGPPRATCGASVGVGVGFGFGQGFGKRFGADSRPRAFRSFITSVEKFLDVSVRSVWSRFRSLTHPNVSSDISKPLFLLSRSHDLQSANVKTVASLSLATSTMVKQ